MKNKGILNPELSYMVANCGHTDYLILADKGFPLPSDIPRVNLGFMDDHPTISQVLRALSTEMVIERLIITEEMIDISSDRVKMLKSEFPYIQIEKVRHSEFKSLTTTAAGAVKTADTCPYANMLVVSGS